MGVTIMKKSTLFMLVLLALTNTKIAHADGQLMVMPARSIIEGMQSRSVQVSNLGNKPLYLNVTLNKIENPGQTPEKKISIGDIEKPEIMTNVAKITLGPGQRREINLVPLKEPLQENLYRLYIVPVSSMKIIGRDEKNKIDAPVTFGVGYGVLIHHMPLSTKQNTKFSFKCIADGITLTADGNISSKLINVESLPAKSVPAEFKVFPGTPRTFKAVMIKGNENGRSFVASCP